MNKLNLDDTITAISTPIGEGGIGIVRLSGKNALKIVDRIFKSAEKKKPSSFRTYTIHYGWIVGNPKSKIQNPKSKEPSKVIDEVILTIMRAPKSYTKEDVVEINCHSGIVPLRKTLDLVLKNGARLAEPGEFTRLAFLNGRIDLIQAESVLDIINAKTEKALAVSLSQLKGKLSQEIYAIREKLLDIYAEIEAIINFPEEDLKASPLRKFSKSILDIKKRLNSLLESGYEGRILREGISVVICGKPNVGKSSLLNLLLKFPRAIVTDIPGTTRDTIEEARDIDGIPLKITDTAGIIEPRDLVEKEAIKRSHESIKAADLIILVLDISQKITPGDKLLAQNLKGKKIICALNKCDLNGKVALEPIRKLLPSSKILKISCLKNFGIAELEKEISSSVWKGHVISSDILVNNIRQIECLRNSLGAVEKAEMFIDKPKQIELCVEELKLALKFLDEVLGKNFSADLLDTIFSKFCIGK